MSICIILKLQSSYIQFNIILKNQTKNIIVINKRIYVYIKFKEKCFRYINRFGLHSFLIINTNAVDAHEAPRTFFVYNIFDDPYKVDAIVLN